MFREIKGEIKEMSLNPYSSRAVQKILRRVLPEAHTNIIKDILEGITFLALTKSHRIGINPNVIQFDKKKCKLLY